MSTDGCRSIQSLESRLETASASTLAPMRANLAADAFLTRSVSLLKRTSPKDARDKPRLGLRPSRADDFRLLDGLRFMPGMPPIEKRRTGAHPVLSLVSVGASNLTEFDRVCGVRSAMSGAAGEAGFFDGVLDL
eukprot:311816-Prymnesium_polylepis.2